MITFAATFFATWSFAQDAQPKSDPAAVEAALQYEAEQRILQYLTSFIPRNSFDATVRVKSSAQNLGLLPYVPSSYGRGLAGISLSRLLQNIEEMRIDLSVADSISPPNVASIKKMLEKRFPNAIISIQTMPMKFASLDNDETAKKFQQLEDNMKKLADEQRQALERQSQELRAEMAKAAEKMQQDQNLAKKEPLYEKIAVPGVVALLLIVGIILSTRIFSSAVTSIGSGMSHIATSVDSLGQSLSGQKEVKNISEAGAGSKEEEVTASAALPSHDEKLQIAAALANELRKSVAENSMHVLVQYVVDMLQKPSDVSKAVAILEFLGRDVSNEVFLRLSLDQRDAIGRFFETGNYGKPKLDIMSEAGEELKTRILGVPFKAVRGQLSLALAEKIVSLSEADFISVAQSLDTQKLSRFVVYFNADRMAATLAAAKKNDPELFKNLLVALRESKEFASKLDLDAEIIKAVDAVASDVKKIQFKQDSQFYESILTRLNDDDADETLKVIAESNPRLKAHLEKTIITFGTFFKLPPNMQEDIVSNLNNQQIAGLIFGLDSSGAQIIQSMLDERRKTLITDEVTVLINSPKVSSQNVVNTAKNTVATAIRKLRDEGHLDEILGADEAKINLNSAS